MNANVNALSLSQEEITLRYFDTLSDEDVDGLYGVYRLDFEMFGYTFSYKNKTYGTVRANGN